jgi:hypothetical protein
MAQKISSENSLFGFPRQGTLLIILVAGLSPDFGEQSQTGRVRLRLGLGSEMGYEEADHSWVELTMKCASVKAGRITA